MGVCIVRLMLFHYSALSIRIRVHSRHSILFAPFLDLIALYWILGIFQGWLNSLYTTPTFPLPPPTHSIQCTRPGSWLIRETSGKLVIYNPIKNNNYAALTFAFICFNITLPLLSSQKCPQMGGGAGKHLALRTLIHEYWSPILSTPADIWWSFCAAGQRE